MSKVFVGTGSGEPAGYSVHVEQNGKRYGLTHRVAGAGANLPWDGGGPHSTDVARALLWHATGVEPEWRIYRLFKSEVVARPSGIGECWHISEQEILDWLAGIEQQMAQAEIAGQTEARLKQSRQRELRLKRFARMFGRKQ